MISQILRTLAVLVLASSMSCGFTAATAQAPLPAPPAPTGDAGGILAPTVEGPTAVDAVVVYSQPPNPSGGILLSSLRDPDGSDTDQWAWDGFRFAWTQTVTEIHWRGAYDPTRFGSGGPVFDFTVDIYPSVAAGTQPDVAHPPLVHYHVGSDANETPAEVLGGVQTYDYQFNLPAPFQSAAGTKYWVQIEALQSGPPDWGLSAGTNGDGQYFRRIPGGGANYQLVPGDAAFTLLAPRLEGQRLYLPLATRAGSS